MMARLPARAWLAIALGLAAAPAPAAPAQTAAPLGCAIEAEQVVDLGTPVIGVLDTVRVDRGDAVKRGQVLATLRSDVERATLQVAETRAQLDAEIRAATASADLAQQRLARAERLRQQNFFSPQALDQARSEHEVAAQRLRQAQDQKKLWSDEYGVAQAQIGQRSIRSPFDGIVVDRMMNPGERVEEKPVLRVAKVDPLRVEVVLPISEFGSIATGATLTVRPDYPGALPQPAKVTRVDRTIDGASNTFRIRLALPNPAKSVPAGARCRIEGLVTAASQRLGGTPVAEPPLALKTSGTLGVRP